MEIQAKLVKKLETNNSSETSTQTNVTTQSTQKNSGTVSSSTTEILQILLLAKNNLNTSVILMQMAITSLLEKISLRKNREILKMVLSTTVSLIEMAITVKQV